MSAAASTQNARLERAQGCLLGQLAGDSLGSLVEFRSAADIRQQYPDGIHELADGGTFDTLAGQPTDDSEMALLLARMLVEQGIYDREAARLAYIDWLYSDPFDIGFTIRSGLQGQHNLTSQANGALMRISPLGIFGANYELRQVAEWARQDATLTHVHPVCQEANALYAMAIATAVREGCDAESLYAQIRAWSREMQVDASLQTAIEAAADSPPADYLSLQGWVLIAFQNALWQLLHAQNLQEGVCDTVMRGGDTDTNAAIAGALLGAVYGRAAIPAQWTMSILACCPQAGQPGVYQPRPKRFWPVDALELAAGLLGQESRVATGAAG
ncbi:MAG: ADP-ribosylglycohydrolase family protein [Chloroflexi bacterium]|nr:ADP-ribosylglycohydrolase family protein [Chloroflexota bacterium]MCY3581354.1 ADP-ribosylglycohydrolase family protein [Chloroflexota bacterium]MCY3716391.1 ADP-ribosylglycohydrolase family protein [Chloroflexota bacterium]MDE2649409.1 ADP-ribosylglycohydrolase family protein [Chloroflexota bacterium]MXX51391.1 ADP-ribosylglycohydrolase family protein [Chloroflexota bacterium]